MNKNMYNEIKLNLINNFFNRNYRFVCVIRKESVIGDIKKRFPFPFKYDYDTDTMTISMGDKVNVDLKFEWNYTEHKKYHLVKIS